jgi:hypothetical protein
MDGPILPAVSELVNLFIRMKRLNAWRSPSGRGSRARAGAAQA